MLNSSSTLLQQRSRELPRIMEGAEAKSLDQNEKWGTLSPFLRRYGSQALAYPTLQDGMEYFVDDSGYIAYVTVHHPVFARKPKQITLSDPVCAQENYRQIIARFLERHPRAVFACVSETCAEALREINFKVNCVGYEVELPIQTYNTRGNWKELDMIKRSRNEAKREGITIREEDIETANRTQLEAVSKKWIETKKVNDREIWLYARRPVFNTEPDVRKFVAYDHDGHAAGFAFYDPMYRDGNIFGYAASISRSDERRFGRLITAIHMEAMEKFKAEGKQTLNLCLAPFDKVSAGKFNDDWSAKQFFELAAKYGNNLYNFTGLAFHKSKYRGSEKFLYVGSRSFWPSNDVYLAFVSADITRGYFAMFGHLLWGMATFWKNHNNSTRQNL